MSPSLVASPFAHSFAHPLAHPSAPALPPWSAPRLLELLRRLVTELRIDVHLPEVELELELQRLHGRLPDLNPAARPLTELHLPRAGLRVTLREADGEQFVYVTDTVRDRLAAYITFNRLVEIHRRADRHLRAPHTKVSVSYRRQRIASTVYRWWLDGGRSAITGARQSPAARALWLSLARDYPLSYVRIENKRLYPLGDRISEAEMDSLQVRAVLLGRGRSLADFVEAG